MGRVYGDEISGTLSCVILATAPWSADIVRAMLLTSAARPMCWGDAWWNGQRG